MSFLNPSFLWGLLAVAIPVIIHLFNFRRTKKIAFTNVAFLKVVETQTSSFRKLKQWLIMAARCLFLACLALAFAQPFFPSKNAKNQNLKVSLSSIYLDNSMSMQNTTDNKRYLDWAVTKIDQLVSIFSQSSTIQLVTNDFEADDQNIGTAERIKNRLTSVNVSPSVHSFEQIYKRQLSLLKRNGADGGNQLFWFSDFQKSTSGNLSKLKIDSTNRLFLMPIQAKNTQNVFVDSVWLATPFVREMQNNALYVKLSNSGSEAIEKLPIKLFIDDKQASTASVSIDKNGSANAVFNFTIREKGFKKGRISFDDQPITFDNDFYFVLNASPTIEVLHLYQNRSQDDYVSKVFGNDSLFHLKSFSALNTDVGQFKNANLIVLEGVDNLSGSFTASLGQFINSGGSLMIFPSAKPNSTGYASFLQSIGIQTITPTNQPALAASQIGIQEPDKANPFFIDVFERSANQPTISTPNQQAVWSWQGLGEKILSFKNGQPFITNTSVGKSGKLYLAASPLDDTFGNFARHGYFLPTMYKIASMSIPAQRTAYGFDEESISLPVADVKQNVTYKLKNGKTEIVPIQRIAGNLLTMDMPKASQMTDNQSLESGYYELQLDGKTQQLIALNHDNQESKMDYYTADELRGIFKSQKNVEVFDNMQSNDFVDTFRTANFGTPLWKYFIMAALAFLLIEILLIRFLKG
jgi:Aerotolerance regulator N-terminal